MTSKSRFIQREISWNAFNARVLAEGMRKDLKLLDRLKFMAITSSNYDEFFMVHVARLMREVMNGDKPVSGTEERPSAILNQLLQEIRAVIEKQDKEVTGNILPALAEEGFIILKPEEWSSAAKTAARDIFHKELIPLCRPIVITPGNTLDRIAPQGRILAAFALDDGRLAAVRMPGNPERFRIIKNAGNKQNIILLDHILMEYGKEFFPKSKITSACLFRVTRDAAMSINEEPDEDFIAAMEEVLESRERSFPVRLETHGNSEMAGELRAMLNLPAENHFHMQAPLKLKSFIKLISLEGFECLSTAAPVPRNPMELPENSNIWETLKKRDVLIHHPYETFNPIIQMVKEAADDPATSAIKMTLYRTSGKSPIVSTLIDAAGKGIQVTVLVELKARFSERDNISWAEKLEKAGAIVVYGPAELKVHAKVLMIERKEDGKLCRYVHLGTGNYNDYTANLYTDMSFMTSEAQYTGDVTKVFNAITGGESRPHLEVLTMAPFSLRKETLRLINREIQHAENGREARITAKMNALVDKEIIEALYSASQKGVKIDLNVRGICCLKPGIKGLSENIRVLSIIDTFLEHTRAFMYCNGGNPEIFLSSADWMPRNLNRRVELLFPVTSTEHKRRISYVLECCMSDNTHSWELKPDGTWKRKSTGKGSSQFRVQESFAKIAAKKSAQPEK